MLMLRIVKLLRKPRQAWALVCKLKPTLLLLALRCLGNLKWLFLVCFPRFLLVAQPLCYLPLILLPKLRCPWLVMQQYLVHVRTSTSTTPDPRVITAAERACKRAAREMGVEYHSTVLQGAGNPHVEGGYVYTFGCMKEDILTTLKRISLLH
jgi:hypothetical protein